MWNLPIQKNSFSEKDTKEWKDANVTYYGGQADFFTNDHLDLQGLYRAAQGIINLADYKYVLNPYNSPQENLRAYPAQMRNMDIIAPIINLFLGEKANKIDTKQVICVNADVPNKMTEDLNEGFLQILTQDFVNKLNESGVQTGVESQEVPDYKQFVDYKKVSYVDARAIVGQEAYDFLKYDLDLKDNYQNGFYDWLVTNRVYTYKTIINDDVKFGIVPPLEMYHGSTDTGFVEDAAWAVRKFRLTASEILDRMNKDLTDDDVAWLESGMRNNTVAVSSITQTSNIDTRGDSRDMNSPQTESGLFDVAHCTWKTFIPYQILTYIDPLTGSEEQMVVDETYKLDELNGDIELEKLWGNQVWEGYRVNDRVITNSVRPFPVQRNEINNFSACKLPYNGRVDHRPSVVKTLSERQAIYNIYNFRGELTLARNKDKLLMMPKGLLPEGWSPDKAMYFAETTGVFWFDETKPNAAAVLSAIKGIDMGLGNYVKDMRDLMRDVKDEAWDAVGMNRQRYGDVNSSDGKGVNEQAVMRSSVISREIFRKFEKLEESDAQGLIEYSKEAWKKGKKGSYIRSDGSHAILDINGGEYQNADLGIFAKDSEEENRKLETARNVANSFAQKGVVKSSTVLEIIDSNNFSKLKAFVRKAEEIEEKLKQAQTEQERATQESIAQKAVEKSQIDAEIKKYSADMSYKGMVDAATIKANSDANLAEINMEGNEPAPESNVNDIRNKFDSTQKLGLQAEKQSTDARNKERELNLKEEEIAAKERIAKQNKNKYDKK